MKTDTLLPYTRVCTYEKFDTRRFGKSRDRHFATPERAVEWIAAAGLKSFTVYRIEKVNGTWRSDWELS